MSRVQQANRVDQVQEVTSAQSLTLVKNLVRTAISSIAYIRNLFPEDCFEKKGFSGTNIRMLQPNSDASRVLCNWLEEGVFEALEKQYLSDQIFAIYTPGDPQDVLVECYEFHFTYKSGGEADISLSVQDKKTDVSYTRESVRDSTARLVRTLIQLTETQHELPTKRYVSIKLQYRDDVTPTDYEPKYFCPGDLRDELQFEQSPYKVEVGKVETHFHRTSLRVKTTAGMAAEESRTAAAASNGSVHDEQEIENIETNINSSKTLYHSLPSTMKTELTPEEQRFVDKKGFPCDEKHAEGRLFDVVAEQLVHSGNFSLVHACQQFPQQNSKVLRGIIDKQGHRGVGGVAKSRAPREVHIVSNSSGAATTSSSSNNEQHHHQHRASKRSRV